MTFQVKGIAGYPCKAGQLVDDCHDLKCRKARPQRPRLQMSEALMLQSVPPYVDTLAEEATYWVWGGGREQIKTVHIGFAGW